MGWAAGIAVFLCLQEPVEVQVESILSRFGALAREEQEGARLVEQLTALGGSAIEPLARRLAEDLRDGAASASAEAILETLEGRPAAQGPLQSAFADGATPSSGRIELARALASLLDQVSWRDGLLAIAANPDADLEDRRRAAELLVEAGDERVLEVLPEIEELQGPDPRVEFREAAELLRRWSEEPRVMVIGEGVPPPPGRPRPPARKKGSGTDGAEVFYYVSLGVAAAGIAAALLVHRRKG